MASKLQRSRTSQRDGLRFEYFELGFGYYLAGRAGYHAHAIPVAGNLFHHAIEMFLKGYLAGVGVSEKGRLDMVSGNCGIGFVCRRATPVSRSSPG